MNTTENVIARFKLTSQKTLSARLNETTQPINKTNNESALLKKSNLAEVIASGCNFLPSPALIPLPPLRLLDACY